MKVIWLTGARKDLNEAVNWLKQHNLTAANRIARLINFQTSQLGTYPQLGRVGEVDGTRELVIQHTRYIAVYRINTKTN